MTNLTSSLTLKLIDDVSKPARTVAQALKDAETSAKSVAKAMAGTGATDRLQKSLSGLKVSAKDIEQVSTAWKDYSKASNLAADSTKWTKAQANDVKAWERQTVKSLREVKAEQQAFYRSQAAAEDRARTHQSRPGVASRVLNHVAGSTAVIAAGGAAGSAVHSAIHQAAEAEQQRFRIRELSRSDRSEAKLADEIAAQIAAKYPSVPINKALDNYVELRANSVGHDGRVDPTIARRNAFAAARAQNAATALGFDMSPEDMQNLLKGVEGSGRADDPKAVEKITDAYVRAKQVFGSAIAASMVRDYVANAKSTNFSIGDDQFYLSNMVRLSEGNASRLGNEVNQTMSTLVGGSMKKAAGDWLIERGLADAKDMVKTGGGNVKFTHGIKDSATLETDQSAWAKGTLREALERKGVVSEDKVEARMKFLRAQELKSNPNAEIDEHFLRNRAEEGLIAADLAKAGFRTTVSDNLAHFIGNARLIERDTKAMKLASGLDAGDRIAENAVGSFKELTGALESFSTVVGSPIMQNAGAVLDSVAHSIASAAKSFGDWEKEHPALAKVASGGAIAGGAAGSLALLYGGLQGLTSGFGLKGSAAALDGAALALDAAAARLGAGGVAGGLAGDAASVLGGGAARVRSGLGLLAGGAASLPWIVGGAAAIGLGMWGIDSIPSGNRQSMRSGHKFNGLFGDPHDGDAHALTGFASDAGHWQNVRGQRSWFTDAPKAPEKEYSAPMPQGWGGAAGGLPVGQIAELKAKADEAKPSLDALNTTVKPQIDMSSVNEALSTVTRLLAELSKVGGVAQGAQSAAQRASGTVRAGVPALGATTRGHFGTSGVQGE